MSQVHAIVWLDHRQARVISFSAGDGEEVEVSAHGPERHVHHQDRKEGGGHTHDDLQYFDEIAAALDGIHEVLIAGPGTEKTAFERYVQERHPQLAQRVVGVETLDHPTDAQLLAHARKSFKRIDQLGLD